VERELHMAWEETARELKLAADRKEEIERYVRQHPDQSGELHSEWRALKDRIASLTFKFNWEFEEDFFAVERME
jgi:hypothetical protein